MIKILGYEIKRLLWNKFYVIFFAITILYGWYTLSGTVIRGIAHTAPFSPWSFGYYLAELMPILLITILFFITYLFSAKEKSVKAITMATPVNNAKYMIIRLIAMGIGYLLLCAGAVLTGLLFYFRMFHWKEFGSLLLPAVITLLPPMLFIMGLGLAAGRIRCSLIYGLMALLLLYNQFPLPYSLDFAGSRFFRDYPMELGILDPAFQMPAAFIAGRLVFALIGLFFTFLNCKNKKSEIYKG